jgi:hypothetical protein
MLDAVGTVVDQDGLASKAAVNRLVNQPSQTRLTATGFSTRVWLEQVSTLPASTGKIMWDLAGQLDGIPIIAQQAACNLSTDHWLIR